MAQRSARARARTQVGADSRRRGEQPPGAAAGCCTCSYQQESPRGQRPATEKVRHGSPFASLRKRDAAGVAASAATMEASGQLGCSLRKSAQQAAFS